MQRGAVLVIGLVLLLVLTVLGVAGVATALTEITMAGNVQFQQGAFQAAETGIELALALPLDTTQPTALVPVTALDDGSSTEARRECTATTLVPFGASDEGINAWHFDVVAVGSDARNARSTHRQSVYVVGPAGDCPTP